MQLFLEPRYIPLIQKPSCCNITCLMMILYRRGYGLFDQEKLAKYFDVRINKRSAGAFNVRLKIYSDQDNADEVGGLRTIESEDIINQFFESRKIRLTARGIKISEISNLLEFLMSNIEDGNDLWVEYKTHGISGANTIHDGLVEGVIHRGDMVKAVIINPSRDYEPRRRVKIDILEEALSAKFARETGFIVISDK